MLDRIKQMVSTFAYVTTGVLFSTALFITVFFTGDSLSVRLLWQILGTSFVCVLGNLLYPMNRELTSGQLRIRKILHYLYINVVVFGCAAVFQWFNIRDVRKAGFMFLLIAVIFFTVSWILWHNYKVISDQLNKNLEKYQDKKSECLSGQDEDVPTEQHMT